MLPRVPHWQVKLLNQHMKWSFPSAKVPPVAQGPPVEPPLGGGD
jgi:hypothetical protein